MRYSIAFLGLIATATAGSSDPNCQKGIQPFLAPLAKEPVASKYCAAKYSAVPQPLVKREKALVKAKPTPTPTPMPKPLNPYVF
jgi:hypothetical protein